MLFISPGPSFFSLLLSCPHYCGESESRVTISSTNSCYLIITDYPFIHPLSSVTCISHIPKTFLSLKLPPPLYPFSLFVAKLMKVSLHLRELSSTSVGIKRVEVQVNTRLKELF
jgi:hypothetical protein